MLLSSKEREMAAREVLGKNTHCRFTCDFQHMWDAGSARVLQAWPLWAHWSITWNVGSTTGMDLQLSRATPRKENALTSLIHGDTTSLCHQKALFSGKMFCVGLKITNLNQRLQVERRWGEPFPCDFAAAALSQAVPSPLLGCHFSLVPSAPSF